MRAGAVGCLGGVENALERRLAVGLLGEDDLLVLAGEEDAAVEEGEQAVVVGLLVLVHDRAVVALVAGVRLAQKQPADVLGQNVWLAVAVEVEAGGRARRRVASVGGEDVAHEL